MVGNVSTYPDLKEMFSLFLVQFSLQKKEKKIASQRSTHNHIKSQLLQGDESLHKCSQFLLQNLWTYQDVQVRTMRRCLEK